MMIVSELFALLCLRRYETAEVSDVLSTPYIRQSNPIAGTFGSLAGLNGTKIRQF